MVMQTTLLSYKNFPENEKLGLLYSLFYRYMKSDCCLCFQFRLKDVEGNIKLLSLYMMQAPTLIPGH